MVSICKIPYKDFLKKAKIEKVIVGGKKKTIITLDDKKYEVNGHFWNINLYKILRNKYCKRCAYECSNIKNKEKIKIEI